MQYFFVSSTVLWEGTKESKKKKDDNRGWLIMVINGYGRAVTTAESFQPSYV